VIKAYYVGSGPAGADKAAAEAERADAEAECARAEKHAWVLRQAIDPE
jgi:hypothetical protein